MLLSFFLFKPHLFPTRSLARRNLREETLRQEKETLQKKYDELRICYRKLKLQLSVAAAAKKVCASLPAARPPCGCASPPV